MRQRKQKKGFMLIKVDLEKAYDCLSWVFIIDTLGKTVEADLRDQNVT